MDYNTSKDEEGFSVMNMLRTTQAYIDLDALQGNADAVWASTRAEVMAVVKADAYGHGAPALVYSLSQMGVQRFAVAALSEAVEVRCRCPQADVLVLGYTPDALLPAAVECGAAQTIFSLHQAEILSALGKNARVHLKLDTGMHRLGFAPDEQALEEVQKIYSLPSLTVEGVYSHLALRDRESDERQFAAFTAFTDELARRGLRVGLRHICDGLGTARYQHMHLDMVRPGGAFYGYGELPGLRPVLTLRSQVACVRSVPAGEGVGYDLLDAADHDRLIATLPFGYSDGVPRQLSHGVGHVVIRGQKAPYTGLLCMDMCMVDVTGIAGVREGDEVFVFGGHPDAMTFPQVAAMCNMNRNGLLSGIARRVPRGYMRGGDVIEVRDLV